MSLIPYTTLEMQVAREQQKMRTALIPPRDIIIQSDPGYPSDKYEENDLTRKFTTRMNNLMNLLNKIRIWRQNDSTLRDYFLTCEDDYDKVITLLQEIYSSMPEFYATVRPYVCEVICRALVRGLACAQLKSEINYTPLFTPLKQNISKQAAIMYSRPHCPTCDKYVRKFRGHVNRCKTPNERIAHNLRTHIERNRNYFARMSQIHYAETFFHNWFL